ncbi:MAG: xanthine dehydrogenase [Deltaproteobacteria bacterium]|nr:xanthine dehydrogenase [Deltaproteobacteria bacterium]
MDDIFEEIVKIRSEGGRAALATITSIKGSAPRAEGSKMLVRSDKSILGSIGGGSLEAQVCQAAMDVIIDGKSRVLRFDLAGKDVAEEGMICGGAAEVFVEPIMTKPVLYIFGGGHISFFISKIGKMLDFRVVVIDDREEFANPGRFPEADETIARDLEAVFPTLKINPSSYIVIVTRGHLLDEKVLEWAVKTDARYVGMIGSRTKNRTVFSHLESRGIAKDLLETVHAPIGLDIYAETPEEIAVSIMAEIIMVRRERESSGPKTLC